MALAFELVSPEALVLSGDAQQVVVPGTEGYFTVMADHAPMMSTIKSGVIGVTMGDGSSKDLYVRGGFADVSPSGLTILAEQAIPLEELDVSSIEKDIEEARKAYDAAEGPEQKEKTASVLADLEDSLVSINYAKSSH